MCDVLAVVTTSESPCSPGVCVCVFVRERDREAEYVSVCMTG